jgi:MYXO-CTERM domain-containing protein
MRFPVSMFRLWRLALSTVALAAGCAAPDGNYGQSDDGALRGEIVSYQLDFEDHSETQHRLRLPSGEERPLILEGNHELTPGERVRVWATEQGESLKVIRFEREPNTVESVRSALVMGKAKPPRRWAFVLINMGGGVGLTKDMATDRLFGAANPKSMKNYYKEISFGLQDLDGEVLGPFNYTPASGCDSSGAAKAIRPMITGTFDQYLWYFGSRQQCDWAGLASLGTSDRPQRDSWYNASSGCVVLAQEPGHNFGMVHSSSLSCTQGGTKVPLALPSDGTCQHSEYGNSFDPMGGGCYHMDGFQKAYQDWLTGCNIVKVTTSGTFTIFPLEQACNGVQLLQVPFGASRTYMLANGPTSNISNYYLELRAPIGVDAQLTPRVFVTVGGNIAEARGRGGRNWLLDMNPTTTTKADAHLPVGKTYADPDPMGPKFTVVSADNTKAVIKVELAGGGASDSPGTGSCDDGSMFTAPGPETCAAPPISSPASDGGAPPVKMDASAAKDSGGGSGGTGGAGGSTGGSSGNGENGTGGAPGKADAAAPAMTGKADAAPPKSEEPDADEGPTSGGNKTVKGGCACRVGGQSDASGTFVLSAVFAAFVLVRRRRR